MTTATEPEIRLNAALLNERDRLRERESFLLKANNATEERRRGTARELQVARSTIQALQEALHNRDESIQLLRDQITNQDQAHTPSS